MSKKSKANRPAPQFPLSEAAMAKAEVHLAKPPVAVETPKEPKAKKVKELHPCLCGCNAMVPRKFKQGHDAKLKGMLQRAHTNCIHPDDRPVSELIARFEEVTGETVKGNTAMALVEALNPEWAKFLIEFRRPGSRKVAAA